jgi:hypothetical protein
VFENRVLRRIFGPKTEEVTEGWSKLHNEELHKLYSSPSVIRMIKLRWMRLPRNVARLAETRIGSKAGTPEKFEIGSDAGTGSNAGIRMNSSSENPTKL